MLPLTKQHETPAATRTVTSTACSSPFDTLFLQPRDCALAASGFPSTTGSFETGARAQVVPLRNMAGQGGETSGKRFGKERPLSHISFILIISSKITLARRSPHETEGAERAGGGERRRAVKQKEILRHAPVTCDMSSKLANKASHPSGRKAMQAVRASHKEERMKLHKIGTATPTKTPSCATLAWTSHHVLLCDVCV
jgi:hypothetical protein